MKRAIGTGLICAVLSQAAGGAMAQPPCDKCKPSIEITAAEWACLRGTVDTGANSDPITIPTFDDGCAGGTAMGSTPVSQGNSARRAKWVYLRPAHLMCLKQQSADITAKLRANPSGTVKITFDGCRAG